MTKSELIGFVRKSNAGNALKLNLNKEALLKAETVTGKDETEYIALIINLAKVKMIIEGEQEVTSVCQLRDDEDEPEGSD